MLAFEQHSNHPPTYVTLQKNYSALYFVTLTRGDLQRETEGGRLKFRTSQLIKAPLPAKTTRKDFPYSPCIYLMLLIRHLLLVCPQTSAGVLCVLCMVSLHLHIHLETHAYIFFILNTDKPTLCYEKVSLHK